MKPTEPFESDVKDWFMKACSCHDLHGVYNIQVEMCRTFNINQYRDYATIPVSAAGCRSPSNFHVSIMSNCGEQP
jgi:hypothetical protein